MYAQGRVTRNRRGGRKNAARLAKAERAREERAKAERARAARAWAEEPDVLADVPIYSYAPAVAPAPPPALPFEAEARELMAYLSVKLVENGEEWLTEEEIGDELVHAAGDCACADETAILDHTAPALRELILLSHTQPEAPEALLTAVSVARDALTRLAAPSLD